MVQQPFTSIKTCRDFHVAFRWWVYSCFTGVKWTKLSTGVKGVQNMNPPVLNILASWLKCTAKLDVQQDVHGQKVKKIDSKPIWIQSSNYFSISKQGHWQTALLFIPSPAIHNAKPTLHHWTRLISDDESWECEQKSSKEYGLKFLLLCKTFLVPLVQWEWLLVVLLVAISWQFVTIVYFNRMDSYNLYVLVWPSFVHVMGFIIAYTFVRFTLGV